MNKPYEINLVKEKSMYLQPKMYSRLGESAWTKGRLNSMAYKTRICNPEGVYQAQKIYELIIREENKSQIIQDVDAHRIATKDTHSANSIVNLYDFFGTYFPDDIIVGRDCDDRGSTIFSKEGKEGFPGREYNTYSEKEYRIRFAFLKDFIKIPLSPKEIAMAQTKKDKVATARMAELVVKEHILNALKAKDINCYVSNHHENDGTVIPCLHPYSKVDFNALVKTAIEYYLNDIVKDLQCVIHLIPHRKTHTWEAHEALFKLSDIEFPTLTKGDKNEKTLTI